MFQRTFMRHLTFCLLIAAIPTVAQNPNPAPLPHARLNPGNAPKITLNEDDKPAFPPPPDGWDQKRENIPHGKLEMVEYDSKTVGTKRKMNIYTPPGYTDDANKDKTYPVLYLLHGIGGDETEWAR